MQLQVKSSEKQRKMMQKGDFYSKTSYLLSIIIITLAAIASAGGLLFQDVYRDIEKFKIGWIGNDLVTLCLVIPIFISALIFTKKGSSRALLLWMGVLGYMFYNYAFYLFGAAFNAFFLVYVALFSLSGYALISGLSNLHVADIRNKFNPNTPVKGISIFLLFISLPLGFVEVIQVLNYIIRDIEPAIPTLIYALDLSIVVPNTALAAILLWKKHPWGYVLAAIMLVKAFTYGMVLSTATTLVAEFSLAGEWDPFMPFYVFVAVGGFIGCLLLLKNLKS